MVALERIWLGVQAQSAKRDAVGGRAVGRSGGAAPFWRMALGITPTVCQPHSAAGDHHVEQGHHVHRHAGERLGCRPFWPDGGSNDENPLRDRITRVVLWLCTSVPQTQKQPAMPTETLNIQ